MQDFMTPPKHVNFHAKKLFGEMGRIVDGSVAYIKLNGGGPTELHTHEYNHLFIVTEGEAGFTTKTYTYCLNCSHTWEQKAALMLAIIITNACKKRRDAPFTHEIPKIIFYGEKIAWMALSLRATIPRAWQEPMLWELLLWLTATMRKTVPWSKGTLV